MGRTSMLTVTHQGAALEAKSDVYNYLFVASFRRSRKMYCRQACWCCLPTMSVRLSPSVGLSQHGPAAANPLLHRFGAVCPAGRRSIDCCTAGAQQRRAAGERGQCHVVSVRRKLNTDLFILL